MAAPVSGLPEYAVMRCRLGYLQHMERHDTIGADEDYGLTPLCKFRLERAKTGKKLFNIKCCNNNKYWALEHPDSFIITAKAAEPNEDESQWSCTLFRVVVDSKDDNSCCMQSVRSQQVVHLGLVYERGYCLSVPPYTESAERFPIFNEPCRFSVRDWESSSMSAIRAPVQGLPRYVVLKSLFNGKYLRQTDQHNVAGSIRVDGDDALSPSCKFELERAKTDKGLWSIRSCYNTKYWAVGDPAYGFIKAVANEPNEDQSKLSCTLFDPYDDGSDDLDRPVIRLRFVHSQELVACSKYTTTLYASDVVEGDVTRFTVIDWESFVRLPKHVAFKGPNGKYLSACTINGYPHLRFDSTDILDAKVAHEIFYTGDGSIRIESKSFNMFWYANGGDNNWILANSDGTSEERNDDAALFLLVKGKDNTIALRNLGYKLFCHPAGTEYGNPDCLNAKLDVLNSNAYFTVEELVLSRAIYNVRFRQADTRFYGEEITTMVTREASNSNSKDETVELKLSYNQKSSYTFNAGFQWGFSVSTTLETGIPYLAGGKVSVSASAQFSMGFGHTTETSSEIVTTHVVTVPPNARVKVSVLATKGKCDIPFSYTVRDTLINGEERIHDMDGGTYTSVSTYNFRYETTKDTLACDKCVKAEVPGDPLCLCKHKQMEEQKNIK